VWRIERREFERSGGILAAIRSIEQRSDLDQRERCGWILLPDSSGIDRDRQPSEREHVAARLGDPTSIVPINLVDHDDMLPRHT